MRHGKKINHLSRKTAHRRLMLANMATSLIAHKRISTTVAKAKALRKYVEPLITKSKDNTTHSRRTVFSYLQDKESINKLFGEVASRVGERPGGYTRIIKMGATRLGDNADMCMMELVDFNDLYKKESRTDKAKPKTRRSRRTKKETTPKGATDTTAESTSAESTSAEPTSTEPTSTEPTSTEPTSTESTSAEPTVKKDDDMPHDDTIAQPDEDKEA